MTAVLVPISRLMAVVGGSSIFLVTKQNGVAWIIITFLIPATLSMHAFGKMIDSAAH